jgi:pyrimidine operon attenuation protein/uracil phosphoribosyltransferase
MNHSHQILHAAEMDRILNRMTHNILEVHNGAGCLALVGIHTRGVFLARRLHEKILAAEGVNVPTGEIDISFYRDDWTRAARNPRVQATNILFSVDNCEIILVDDVLFTGRTVRAGMDALIDFGRPARIELAVLVDRGHRELPIQADFAGKTVETRRNETVNVLLKEIDGSDAVMIRRETTESGQ